MIIQKNEITNKNFNLYAAQNYINHRALDIEEFYEDLNKFKYLKKLFTKYKKTGELKERLILNHIISIFNVFKINSAIKMCFFKIDEDAYPALKTFLLYLNYIKEDDFINISCDLYVTKQLKNI